MNEPRHHAADISRSVFDRTNWFVRCACGYTSGPHVREIEAMNDADEHALAMMHVDDREDK
jgi:hypothetical protein